MARDWFDLSAAKEGRQAALALDAAVTDEATARTVEFYLERRAEGMGHTLAEMLATRQGPALLTDAVFLEGHCNGNQFAVNDRLPRELRKVQEDMADGLRKTAEAGGQSTAGKVYVGGLARFPGDPEAWVSGRGDVQRVLEQRDWGADGAVSRQRKNPPKAYRRGQAVRGVKPWKERIRERLGVKVK